ncbi:MAG: dihydrolipoyl dehydrogenase [Candidatus Omnitrophica bacterium]|nr:dihydrolipoyl dehydrogenase [Candidatus Omnitrophota bacterium]
MYDLAIIGAGWAGFNACIRAKELNLKVALIEKAEIGGTCLNLGCIPTKALIHSAKIFNLAKESSDFGVESVSPTLNFVKVTERKNRIIDNLRSGMRFMLKGVDLFNAEAKIISPCQVDIGGKIIETKSILLATGSSPLKLDQYKFDGKKIISSNEAISLRKIPSSLLIIGGGVIGCEFASLFSAFGTEVTIIEKMPRLLWGEDSDITGRLEASFRKKGIKINTGANRFDVSNGVNQDSFDFILVSVGRAPHGDIPGLGKIGVKLEKGRVITDNFLKTNIDNIYAAGDCTGGVMLAHFAGYQGRLAAENISGKIGLKKKNSSGIPNCIFTDPEVASVGLTQEKAVKEGIDVEVKKFDFMGLGAARILNEPQGLLKIVSDKKDNAVLGASIIGPKATEIIGILTLAVSCRLRVEDLRSAIFAHPTISEAISEALR